MYVITARLAPDAPDHTAPHPEQIRNLLLAQVGDDNVALGHVYSKSDHGGVSAVLYVHAPDLASAELGARNILARATSQVSECLANWSVTHCEADLITEALDRLIQRDVHDDDW